MVPMIGKKDRHLNFFDEEIFSRMIPKDHPLYLIKQHVDFSFVEETVRDLYTEDTGRPSYPPETMFRILFLEIFANLSDVQVVDALRYNLLYRYFCEIGFDDPVPDDTTLVVFRRRLGEEGFRKLFARVVEEARQKGLLKGEWMIVDGTKVKSHAAERGTIELLREGRRRVLKEVAQKDPEKAQALEELAEAVDDRLVKNQEELLKKEVERTEAFLTQAEAVETKTAPVLKAIALGQGPESLVDPDARWGFQKKGKPFFGYKQILACDESGFVTALEILPGNESESTALDSLLNDLEARGLLRSKLAADRGYDGKEIRTRLKRRGIRTYVPARRPKDRLPEGFTYDERNNRIVCPQGKGSQTVTPHQQGGFLYTFSARDCGRCPLRDRCVSPGRRAKAVYYRPDLHAGRPRGIRVAMRVRRAVERVFGEEKVWHRMDRLRYNGRARAAIQAYLTAIVVDVKKMARRLTKKSAPATCPAA
jgi:transposase